LSPLDIQKKASANWKLEGHLLKIVELEDLKPSCCLGMCCAPAGDVFICAYFFGYWFAVEGAVLELFCFGRQLSIARCNTGVVLF